MLPWIVVRSVIALSLLCAAQIVPAQTNAAVRKLTIESAGRLSNANQKQIVSEIVGRKYSGSSLNEILDEIAERIRYDFEKYGYVKVLVDDPKVVSKTTDHEIQVLDLVVPVQEGEQYRLKTINFSNTRLFTTDELRRAFPIVDGDVLDREKLGLGLENLRDRYCMKGYVNFTAVPVTQVDDGERTVTVSVDLDGGALFHVGKLTVRGDESVPGAREKLLNTWKAYEGTVYDCNVLARFLRDLHARPKLKPEQIFETSIDDQKHLVNVYIALERPIF